MLNTIDLKITGKNIERFIKRLNHNNIEIYDIKYIKYNEIIIRIKKEDLDSLNLLKTIYKIDLININGFDKIKLIIKNNLILIICFILSIFLIYYMSNTIFSINVIHNNKELRNLLIKELENNNIKKYKQKKSYKELQIIKKKILDKYNDKIEWLEIENIGTKYIVRLEERIIKNYKEEYKKRDIIALKDARIMHIYADAGEIVKPINTYVHKGDTIISGSLKIYDEVKSNIMAKGSIYGEVWYKVKIEYPFIYHEKILTGKKRKVFVLKFLNHNFEILNFKKYKTKITKDKILSKHTFLPISFIYQTQYETKETYLRLTKKQAMKKAIQKVKDKINSNLSEKEYINDIKKLKVEENNSKIILELFVSVCENITDYKDIIEE